MDRASILKERGHKKWAQFKNLAGLWLLNLALSC